MVALHAALANAVLELDAGTDAEPALRRTFEEMRAELGAGQRRYTRQSLIAGSSFSGGFALSG